MVVATCLGRASAVARHPVWSLAFLALVTLLVLEPALPTWSVPVGDGTAALPAVADDRAAGAGHA